MSLPVILRADAKADARKIWQDIEQARPGWGDRFLVRLEELIERIESFPESYGIVWQDVRAAPVKKFRYVAYYTVFSNRVDLFAVMHGSRDASAWQSRV